MLAISSATRSSTGEERSRDDAHTGNLLTIVVGAGCADGQRRRRRWWWLLLLLLLLLLPVQ
jgi:hypothetical protein